LAGCLNCSPHDAESLTDIRWKKSKNLANVFPTSCVFRLAAMVVIATHEGQGSHNFNGFADHDAFTADVRLQTERYGSVRHHSEPVRRATRVSRISDIHIWEFG